MAFQEGISNKKGRPKGAKNKVSQDLRLMVSKLLENQFINVQNDFENLRPHQRVRMFAELLPFVVPKMKDIDASVRIEQLSDQELDKIIEKITKNE